ncbi:hypothetical protein DIS24_g782 [Lasiodiplodia hormozganensis]|uniref:Uncharacterized protein n=1 Tax=Lasiodiplodia hormozganensis TaxID=869390 RepID=A0AA39Z511_9PEZI|nr:hypothetical protein DIS24_g782 [Lasiodiplodia hormozganensis]
MSASTEVYRGVWKDHANGVWTLTLTERSGGILSAALIIFAGFASVQAWNIVKFVLHQALSSQKPQDGYRHNLRTVLRNSNSHTQAFWLFLRLAFGWRKKLGLSSTLARGSIVTILSLLFVVASAVIRLYISLIWTANGDQVLINSTSCGAVSIDSEDVQSFGVYWTDRIEAAATYVRECYNTTDTSPCSKLPVSSLNWTSSDGDCPFTDSGLCITNNSVPLVMDTGYINSNYDLGMNAEAEDAIDYRKIVTCSPMRSDHVDIVYRNQTDENILLFYYGNVTMFNSTSTYNYSGNYLRYVNGYTLSTLGYDPYSVANVWFPNASITDRADAGASIFFLAANYMLYLSPVSDPLFSTYAEEWTGSDSEILSTANYPWLTVTMLGCIEQHQICKAATSDSSRSCGPFSSSRGLPWIAIEGLGLSGRQTATAARLMSAAAVQQPDLGFVARWMPGDPLLASRTEVDGTQFAALPVDQWRREVSRWFAMSLALLQESVVQYVTGPSDPGLRRFVLDVSEDPDALADCRQQRVRRAGSGYTNFHLGAVIVVVVVGCALSFVGLTVDTIVGFLEAHFHFWEYGRLQWLLDGTFQQQRLAYEAAGVANWRDAASYVPVTDEKMFPLIDGLERDHPRLHQKNADEVDAQEAGADLKAAG